MDAIGIGALVGLMIGQASTAWIYYSDRHDIKNDPFYFSKLAVFWFGYSFVGVMIGAMFGEVVWWLVR